MLTRNHRQEVMSRSYVQVVAGLCGLGFVARDFDYGLDLTLFDIVRRGRRRVESGFKLDVQAKSTTLADLTDTVIPYDLDVKNYEDLRDPSAGCPRILVVLVLPADEGEWLEQTAEHLLLRRSAYWLSLRGFEPSLNRKSVRVMMPRANLFSVEALAGLMAKVRRKEPL